MKITQQRLKEIIKEELVAISESGAPKYQRPGPAMVASAYKTGHREKLQFGADGIHGRPWTDGYPSGEGALSAEDDSLRPEQKIDALIQRGWMLKMGPRVLLPIVMSLGYEYEDITAAMGN